MAQIAKEAKLAAIVLNRKQVDPRYCVFSPQPDPNNAKIWAPTQAMTKFQMEQALGDWAEESVRLAINKSRQYKAVPFGDNDKTLSESEDFASLYRAGKSRELEFGKRSDLLLFENGKVALSDACSLSGREAEKLCKDVLAGLEVRSSRTSAIKFAKFQSEQKELGKRPARMETSFTVKVEDLSKVYRWIARNKRPVIYIQVFFDSVYALNFLDVFKYINEKGDKLKLENPARSGKYTIMIPVSVGTRIGDVEYPDFDVVHTQHANGRHDIYAVPRGGRVQIDVPRLIAII